MKSITVKQGETAEAINFVKNFLEEHKVKDKEKVKALLMAEEVTVGLLNHTTPGGCVKLTAKNSFGSIYFDITAPGEEFELMSDEMIGEILDAKYDSDRMSANTEGAIRSIMLKSFSDQLKYKNSKGRNHVRITAVTSRYALLYMTLTGLFAGLAFGLMMNILPDGVAQAINNNIFSLITTVFMNGLQTVVGPVVFFSIATAIAGFGNLSDIGKIGGKVMLAYILTSILSIVIGTGLFFVFQPGDPSVAQGITATEVVDQAAVAEMGDVSLKSTIIGLVPSNIIKPFYDANMLQIIVLAIFCGAAAGLIGQFSTLVKDIFEAMNELFLKITVILVQLIPLVTFCSMASMMVSVGGDSIVSVLGIAGVILLGLLAMMVVYCILIVVFTGQNPLIFFRKYAPTMLQVFSLSSSNASIPLNMKACGEKLGISPKIYSFSIPLGATINMNGICIQLAVSALAIANIYGVDISGRMLVIMCTTIILLSMGAPGIPGIGLILLTVILTQFNVPVEGVSLLIGIYPILDMFITTINCLGDVAMTFIVAKSEKLLDTEAFRAREAA